MNEYKILIVDDEASQREPLAGFLTKKSYNIEMADSIKEAHEKIIKNSYDLVLSDYRLGDGTGEDVIKIVKEKNPQTDVIVITAYGNVELAVDLMKIGAYDYIQKPIDLNELLILIERCFERKTLINENSILKSKLSERTNFNNIISESLEMEEVLNTSARVASSKASVLIRGESGTGKELIARAIHSASNRKDKPFIVVNAAAMPETLFESELFGHEKGSFTGANNRRIGKFEQANQGTLFIDEVGDIPLPIQVKLLRAVQFGQIERLGSNEIIELDVRIITATNRNLEEMISKNEFREDLFYRFNVVSIDLPPLRKRKSDLPALIKYFIEKYSSINFKKVVGTSKEANDVLMMHDYPGNIRELENIIQRAVVLTRGDLITINDLPTNLTKPKIKSEITCFDNIQIGDLNLMVDELETNLIKRALEITKGNQVKAANLLNISERTLRYKISRLNL